jgi:hypothetical protein
VETADTAETKAVQMRFRKNTLEAVDKLSEFFETSNRTDVVARSIRLAHSIATELMLGGRIELHRKDGRVCELLIQ